MNDFLLRVAIFVLPLILLLSVPFVVLKVSGEQYVNIEPVLDSPKKHLIGYAYNEQKYKYIKWYDITHQDKNDVIALGSSRVLQFREEMFNAKFYNAGYTVSYVQEFQSFMNTIPSEYYPEYLIVGLDQWMFIDKWDINTSNNKDINWTSPDIDKLVGKVYMSVYMDIFKGKYSCLMFENRDEIERVGLNAIVNNKGFRNDGSMFYGNQIDLLLQNDESAYDYKYRDTYKRIKLGSQRFVYSNNVGKRNLNRVDDFFAFCRENQIKVIAFLPPFADSVLTTMLNSGNYEYLKKVFSYLKPIVDKYNFELYDFTYMDSTKNHMLDGFHGSEWLYQKMLIKMLSESSCLSEVANIEQLKSDWDSSLNSYTVYSY